jgi:hypothetical protein
MWRRWNELGSLGRFEFWTRASVYVLLAAVPVVLAVVLAAGHQVREPGLAVFLLLSVAQAGVCIALLHAGLGRYLAAGPQPDRWLVASAAALTAAGALTTRIPAFTLSLPGTEFPVSLLVAALFGGALILALTPLLSLRALVVLVLVSAAAASGLTASAGRAGTGVQGQLLIVVSLFYAFIVGVGGSPAACPRGRCGSCPSSTGPGPRTPAWRSPRSGCASPATCTTCSAGTCP